jgi:hypothetical protein
VTGTRTTAATRRVRLVPQPSVPVAFTGTRAAEGPLTLGQLGILRGISVAPDHFFATLCAELPVPDGASVDDVVESLAVLLSRHESLRTHYIGGEHPHQRVAASGTLMVKVRSLNDGTGGPAVAQTLIRWLRTHGPFAQDELPLRVAVAVSAGRVVACAAEFSHLAVDHRAIEIVRREFAELVGDRSTRHVGAPRHQPLDQAALEATPAARRRADKALSYWETHLGRMPGRRYAEERTRAGGESLALELSSPAAALAVRRIAARTRAGRSSVVLAAICVVLGERTGHRRLVFPLVCGNRLDRHLTDYVGTVAQGSIVTIAVDQGGFDAVVTHTWGAVLEACRHSMFDAYRLAELGERIGREHGITVNYEPLFNDVVGESRATAGPPVHPEDITAAMAGTRFSWTPMPAGQIPVRFDLYQLDDAVRLTLWNSGTHEVPRAEMESLLLAVERLLVEAARNPTARQ